MSWFSFFLRPPVLFFFLRVIAFCTIKKVDLLIKAKYADRKIGLKKKKTYFVQLLFCLLSGCISISTVEVKGFKKKKVKQTRETRKRVKITFEEKVWGLS